LIKDLNLMVIDIGSNLGVYTLFASKLERDVLSVEPFEDKILRFRKAVKIQALEKRITLLNNLVYNKPGIVKRIGFTTDNYGNQIIQKKSDEKYQEMENKFLVKSIVMDDLINFLPINPNTNKVYEKAILKIDIEGFEAYAFQSASNLLKSIDIRFIFMEWTHVKKAKNNTIEYKYLVEMVELLKSNGYKPYTLSSKLLELGQFQKWNIKDVLWKKEELKG
jgi:FkbM family methyltransferase